MPISEFADRINEIMPLIMRNFLRQQSAEFYKMKLTIPQFAILDYLGRQDDRKMTDIANIMNVTTAAATGTVDKLVKYGYVKRSADPNDRRIIRIKVTPKGGHVLNKLIDERRQMIMNIFGKISEEDRKEYLRILTCIKEHSTRSTAPINRRRSV